MLISDKEDGPSRIVLVTQYQPDYDILGDIVNKNWDYLGKSSVTQPLHQQKLLVGYRRPKNLRDLIVRADVRLPKKTLPITNTNAKILTFPPNSNTKSGTIQSTVLDYFKQTSNAGTTLHGSTSMTTISTPKTTVKLRSKSNTRVITPNMIRNKCIAKKHCTFCPKLNTSGSITCHVTKQKIESKCKITCMSSNLVYCITCKTCGIQYVGQTKRTIKERFQGHFTNIGKASKKATGIDEQSLPVRFDPIGTHFTQPGHRGTQDVQISVLAFITNSPQTKEALKMRLKVEKKWIHIMRCPAPSGLNIFD